MINTNLDNQIQIDYLKSLLNSSEHICYIFTACENDKKGKSFAYAIIDNKYFVGASKGETINDDTFFKIKILDIANIEQSYERLFSRYSYTLKILHNSNMLKIYFDSRREDMEKTYKNLNYFYQKTKDELKFIEKYEVIFNEVKEKNIYPPKIAVKHNGIFSQDFIIDYIKQGISSRNINVKHGDLFYTNLINSYSIIETDKIMQEIGLQDYSIVEITRTTHSKLKSNTYFYKIDSNLDLILVQKPYIELINNDGEPYIAFDKKTYEDSINNIIRITNKDIKDFQFFGTELVESTVFSASDKSTNVAKPKIIGTMFSEFLFGTSYAILKGISNMMKTINYNQLNISTNHQIRDTRVVQVILNDLTDIEMKGIAIYYDFNRKMGNVKNKEQIFIETKDSKPDYINELRELKMLLDEGILTEDEFNEKKLSILQKNK